MQQEVFPSSTEEEEEKLESAYPIHKVPGDVLENNFIKKEKVGNNRLGSYMHPYIIIVTLIICMPLVYFYSNFAGFIGHLSHSGDLLFWFFVCLKFVLRGSYVNIFFSITTGPIFPRFGM